MWRKETNVCVNEGFNAALPLRFQKQNASVLDDYRPDAASPDASSISEHLSSVEESLNGSSNFSFEIDQFSELTSNTDMLSFFMISVHLFLTVMIFLFLIWHPLNSWWQRKNMRTAADLSSPFSHLPLPPGSWGLPIIGETFQWITQGGRFNVNRRKKYGKVFKTNVIGLPMVRVTGHENVKQVLQGEHVKVTTIWPKNIREILGKNGMINSVGAVHRMKRRITCKAFTSAALNSYIPLFHHVIKEMVGSLSSCEKPLMYDKLNRLTYDLAALALIGLDPKNSVASDFVDTFYTFVVNTFSVPIKIPGFGFSKALKAREILLERLQDHITEKKNAILENISEKNEGVEADEQTNVKTAFDVIIRELILEKLSAQKKHDVNSDESDKEEVEPINDLTLKEIAMELMFAGYATTGSALTSCILELARHPDVIKKLEEEMFQHGLLRDDDDGSNDDDIIDLQLVHKLTYMENVLKETLRIRPPVLGGYRKAMKTFQLGDYRIPKGWTVIYNIRDTHEYEFEDVSDFKPERFESMNTAEDKYRFIPFGGGPRQCIGREYARLVIKLTLIEMIRTYKGWDLVNPGMPKMKAIPVLHPVDGLPCNFHPREKFGVISR